MGNVPSTLSVMAAVAIHRSAVRLNPDYMRPNTAVGREYRRLTRRLNTLRFEAVNELRAEQTGWRSKGR